MRIPFAKVSPLAKLPTRGTPGSAGLDLFAAVGYGVEVTLRPFERSLVPTGLQIQLPAGFEAQVRPRSGLALRHGITVLNSPGTIDADYLGAIFVLLINLGSEPFVVRQGDAIAQLVVAPVVVGEAVEAALVDPKRTTRGEGGFGSTSSAKAG
jgi:dUTP pyrophosphatase